MYTQTHTHNVLENLKAKGFVGWVKPFRTSALQGITKLCWKQTYLSISMLCLVIDFWRVAENTLAFGWLGKHATMLLALPCWGFALIISILWSSLIQSTFHDLQKLYHLWRSRTVQICVQSLQDAILTPSKRAYSCWASCRSQWTL